jgi:hypothetical protein
MDNTFANPGKSSSLSRIWSISSSSSSMALSYCDIYLSARLPLDCTILWMMAPNVVTNPTILIISTKIFNEAMKPLDDAVI